MRQRWGRVALLAGALIAGAAGAVAALECPLPQVLARPGLREKSTELAAKYSAEGLLSRAHDIMGGLRKRFPDASAPARIDFLIAAYCQNIAAAPGLTDAEREVRVKAYAERVRRILY